jgi:hypothetical protein
MRNLFLHIILLFSLAACKNKAIEKPVWLNESATVQMPDAILQFSSTEKKWKATLQSFTQPIPLQLNYHDSGFVIRLLNQEGVTEGKAQIILDNSKQYFYYDVLLVNKQTSSTKKDYRSPKTVNPDSSLQQQRILHQIDANRNIISINNNYFFEEEITLSPKAGSFRAIANEPMTAYYVQAGSCVSIIVKSTYNKEKEMFTVTTGPLKDKYNNTVADGTLVAFIYHDGEQTHRMEAVLLDGVANVFIPSTNKKYLLYAKVNETISNTISLTP